MLQGFPLLFLLVTVCRAAGTEAAKPVPVVLWHGMGDTCCSSSSLGKIIKLLEQEIPGVYVHSIRFGQSSSADLESGYFGNLNDEVTYACNVISSDPELSAGYHAVGFSQGGQFLRAVAQRCPKPQMRNLITLGAQHQGVNALPRCAGSNNTLCSLARKLVNFGAYKSFVQRRSVQAQYWHDPLDEKSYREKSIFLADINNERQPHNITYADNLMKLKNLVMVQFENDTMVTPRESSTFGFYATGQVSQILPMNQTLLYTEDRIGLKELYESGRLVSFRVPGDHLQLNMVWFKNVIVAKYLNTD